MNTLSVTCPACGNEYENDGTPCFQAAIDARRECDKLKGDCEAWSNSFHAMKQERDALKAKLESLQSHTVTEATMHDILVQPHLK